MTTPAPQDTKPPPKRPIVLIAVIMITLVIAAIGIFMREVEASKLHRSTEDQAITDVVVIKAPQGPATEEIVLPGTVQAWHEAPIFARTSGYLKDWKTDIGTPVKTGDVLAEIETPEVDAQLHQAEADFATAQANNQLAQSTAKRWENLLKTNSVSKQDADEKISAAAASAAGVASAQANVDRLKQLEGFKNVTAPFDGVITARNTDTGALINAGSSSNGPELFHIAETDKLRVYVQVPETYAAAITPDLVAELSSAEHPGKLFKATLTRTADAIDPVARTLLVELEVDNEKGELMPGSYTEAHIKLASPASTVRLPANALLFRAEGLQAATVDDDNKVRLQSIKVSRDFGNDVEVQSGVTPGETIIVNPPDSLAEGQPVRIVTPDNGKDDDDKNKNDDSKDDQDDHNRNDKNP